MSQMQDRDSAEIARKMITPLQPREVFRGNWKGEGRLIAHSLLRWLVPEERIHLSSEARWLSETIWIVTDHFEFSSGRIIGRKMFAELVAPDRVHVTADDMPLGADILLFEDGFQFTLRCSPFFGQKIVLLKVDRRRRACGNCEKVERSLRGLFQASVAIRALCGFPSAASVSTGLGFSFFFAPFFFLGVFHKKILRQDRLATTIAPSVDR